MIQILDKDVKQEETTSKPVTKEKESEKENGEKVDLIIKEEKLESADEAEELTPKIKEDDSSPSKAQRPAKRQRTEDVTETEKVPTRTLRSQKRTRDDETPEKTIKEERKSRKGEETGSNDSDVDEGERRKGKRKGR